MAEDELMVDGFLFSTREEAREARKEQKGVKHLKDNMDMKNSQAVFTVYQRLLEQGTFKTVIGFIFLKELQQMLLNYFEYSVNEIHEIPVRFQPNLSTAMGQGSPVKEEKPKEAKTKGKSGIEKDYHNRYRTSVIFNILLLIGVCIMIIIASTANNVNILNYENKVIDKYASWQEELEKREDTVKAKEQELMGR